MEGKSSAIAQRSLQKLHFNHKDMDYYFSWILGRVIYEGSEREECFGVARRIVDGDAPSWQSEWPKLAAEVEEQANQALTVNDLDKARKLFLRASTYYRAPLFIMGPGNLRFREYCNKMQTCFQKAAALFGSPIEFIQVPFQDKSLPGYFWKVDNSLVKRPTLIVVGGVETFIEDCYFITGQTGPRRGYNIVTVDLPGQGLNPDQGLFFEARMEIPLRAVIDYFLARPEIDLDRLALFGFSWGGHIVFKGAQYDRRIQALIANPAMPDVFRAAWAQQAGHNRSDPVNKIVFSQIAWRFGLQLSLSPRVLARRFAKAYDYLAHGRAKPGEIHCPTLCMAGEGEARITLDIARESCSQLPHPLKKLVIFTREQGGEAHCQVNNLALPNGVMFDWLDNVFRHEL